MRQTTHQNGGALMITMLIIVVLSGIVATSNLLSSSQIYLTARSADYDAMQTTAEGLIDFAYGKWKQGMKDNAAPLTTAEATALVASANRPPLPSTMQYVSFTITALDTQGLDSTSPTSVPTLSQNPKGWQANSYQYAARVVLVSTNSRQQKKVTMQGILRHDLVPPVGGLFYFEGDFELYKPAPMIIGGNVHTNSNGFVTTHYTDPDDKLRFLSTSNVSFVGSYSHTAAPFATQWSSSNGGTDVQTPIYDRGFGSQVSKADKLEGIGMGTAAEFDTSDANHNNDGNHELIEPPEPGDDPEGIANSRIYNNAGLVIEIAGMISGTPNAVSSGSGVFTGNNVKITAKNGSTLTVAKANSIIAALSNAETTTTTYYDSTLKKNVTTTTTAQRTMFDKREDTSVLVSDVDVGTLGTTLNTVSGFNGIMYVQNTASGTQPKGIRLQNGGVLPTNGLTVATPGGMYVVGDYNTGTTTDPSVVPSNVSGNPDGTSQSYKTGYSTKPAAIAADAVMFLSNNWDDNNDSKSLSNRPATHTTINSAIISGYIPSGYENEDTGETYWYSGGANNFPRFLENWGGKGMTFTGAFVQLFKSQMFRGEWDTGDIYGAPNRRWSFDRLLLERVIPGIPAASAFSRGQVGPL